jgi:glycosyltransferase involved in cell wall biosynthesis
LDEIRRFRDHVRDGWWEGRRLRIAQVAPLYESVPPHKYGGTERVVSYLTEELVRLGHDVTLFASGDSATSARLEACAPRSLRTDPDCPDALLPHIAMVERVFKQRHRFDIIHFHVDYLAYPACARLHGAHLSTLHGRLDLSGLPSLYREFHDVPVVSISEAQREPLPWLNWLDTVPHGLPPGLHHCREQPGQYLAFLGRISPEKGVDQAIAIACKAGVPLKIAAKVDPANREYHEQHIRPLLETHRCRVEFIGEVGGQAKDEFLGNALALLFPIDWPEPFGLVMIEAMACGTPVIAYPRGSVPEVMEDGKTGFIVPGIDEAVEAVRRVARLSRRTCREVFERRFSVSRMALDYLDIYGRLLARRSAPNNSNGAARHGEGAWAKASPAGADGAAKGADAVSPLPT